MLERVANKAWTNGAPWCSSDFIFHTNSNSPEEIVGSILRHVRRVAPGLEVPFHEPRVVVKNVVGTAGTFNVDDGYVSITLAPQFLMNRRAISAIMAHELCHYLLENNGIREHDSLQNERLTDATCFVLGLGQVVLEGYRVRADVGEYRFNHRLGYLTEEELLLCQEFSRTHHPRSSSKPKEHDDSRLRLLIPDAGVRTRLLARARTKHPELSENELRQSVIDEYERDRR